jgi:pyrimidine operon attenuation protein/uracil phosphoribosyltransferase
MTDRAVASRIADAATVAEWIDGLGARIAAGDENRAIALVGVPRRGVPIADRIASVVRRHGRACTVGQVDPTLWRDDFDASAHHVTFADSVAPADIEGRPVVIVDDVLMTGRTVRAVLDHVMVLGRPSRVQLAVLIDRGCREVPIQPDFVAVHRELPREWLVEFRVAEIDGIDEVLVTETAGVERGGE